jgi:hypothetical protein
MLLSLIRDECLKTPKRFERGIPIGGIEVPQDGVAKAGTNGQSTFRQTFRLREFADPLNGNFDRHGGKATRILMRTSSLIRTTMRSHGDAVW